ncbi:hypothetical protein L227DRAFT_191532 [Lentinus tigrinus ALCF2SS1-6]|uniref:Uncharacterized protein n=1 Tax=Lentinus tigrinus ALCF2SS1-6 TaxID=1328759 RepID=A0A5C2S512_9APHY|nr:hypothetical protein L227DRAFT_191532 [Lentinus tigrinus ALCF2SS1-6]
MTGHLVSRLCSRSLLLLPRVRGMRCHRTANRRACSRVLLFSTTMQSALTFRPPSSNACIRSDGKRTRKPNLDSGRQHGSCA